MTQSISTSVTTSVAAIPVTPAMRLRRFMLWSGLALSAFTASTLLARTIVAQPVPATNASAAPFSVRVVGKGRPMLLIPGLTSGGGVWNGTVDALARDYELHVFTLAGFAGQPATAVDSTWLPRMRDSIIAYSTSHKLRKPVIVGHSLGGFLALWIGSTAPDLPGAIINVDGLPFIGATQDTNATPATVRTQADAMRKMMSGGTPDAFVKMQEMQLRSMIRDTSWLPVAMKMGRTSDPATTAEAMHALYTTDVRRDLAAVKVPVLNLHAWVAYKQYGVTRASTEAMLASQYRTLRTGTTHLNDTAYHFIMIDEPAWLLGEIRNFLAVGAPRGKP